MIMRFCILFLFSLVARNVCAFHRKCPVHDSPSLRPDWPRYQQDGHERFRRDILPGTLDRCTVRYSVPVVWHIIMDSARSGSITNNIVKDSMNVLNEGFHNSSVVFRLHSIHRVTNNKWSNDCLNEKNSIMTALAAWPATHLNVYTCNIQGELLGLATLPWEYEQENVLNGVFIHSQALPGGNIPELNQGKNLVHEVGHYFGLLHYFEERNCSSNGDLVDDTPASKSETYDCTKNNIDTCPGQPGYDPVHNYMGYGNDRCVYEFTAGQIKRMKWALDTYKNKTKSDVYRPCAIDSIFRWSNGLVYIFSGRNYYRYSETLQAIHPDYPRAIDEHWRGIPDNIDAVFRSCDGMTYFFKGSHYFRFNDSALQVDPDYPKNISEFWNGIPDDIDDVIQFNNGYAYFFKGSLYYRFNAKNGTVDVGYPKPMSDYWTGVPEMIEAAFLWYNGDVYFFKEGQFWLFTPNTINATGPRPVQMWWRDPQQFKNYSVFRHCNGYTYFFSGSQYWRFNDMSCSVDLTYPQPSSSNWLGFPHNITIDAMFVWSDGVFYVFAGEDYYGFNQTTQTLIAGYPQKIAADWLGIPSNVEAVFRSNDGLTYFFKGSSYYLLNDTNHQVATGYPKPISSFWTGVPSDLDTVVSWSNGQTYFFKQNYYYRFNYTKGTVDDGYPRHVSEAWKGVLYFPW